MVPYMWQKYALFSTICVLKIESEIKNLISLLRIVIVLFSMARGWFLYRNVHNIYLTRPPTSEAYNIKRFTTEINYVSW